MNTTPIEKYLDDNRIMLRYNGGWNLIYALSFGRYQLAIALLNSQKTLKNCVEIILLEAIKSSNLEMIQLLLKNGADISYDNNLLINAAKNSKVCELIRTHIYNSLMEITEPRAKVIFPEYCKLIVGYMI